MSDVPVAGSAPVAPGGYARKATGLVRQVTGLDQFLFNAASTTPLGLAVVFGLFALTLFPRSNPYVAMIVALIIGIPVWIMFSLMSAAIPRIGGDYTFNSRVLHPIVGLASNLSVFISTAIAMGLWAWWFGTQGLSPAFAVIGSVNNSSTFTRWATDTDGHNKGLSFAIAIIALIITSALAARGTKVVTRVMTILFLIAAVGFAIDIVVLLFTSQSSFRSTVDSTVGAGDISEDGERGQGVRAASVGGRLVDEGDDRCDLLDDRDHPLHLVGHLHVRRVQGGGTAQAPARHDGGRRPRTGSARAARA